MKVDERECSVRVQRPWASSLTFLALVLIQFNLFGGNLSVVAFDRLPPGFPTHGHAPAFWEALGRAVATFGFLEETFAKAIFAFTGMREISEEQITAAYESGERPWSTRSVTG